MANIADMLKGKTTQTAQRLSNRQIDEIKHNNEELKDKLNRLNKEHDKVLSYLKGITWHSVPFVYDNKYNISIFSDDFDESWVGYKKLLASRWKNELKNKRVIEINIADKLYCLGWFITAGLIVASMIFHWNRTVGINIISFSIGIALIYEVVTTIISVDYYVARPNRINKRLAKSEVKRIDAEIKLVETQYKTNENLIEAYNIASINPTKIFNDVKGKTAEDLQEILNDTVSNVIPNIPKVYQDVYKNILDMCGKLLDLGEENGRIITEISKIYMIYINDINNVLMNSDIVSQDRIMTLLNNFENYISRKIKKFEEMSKMSIENDIDALNSAFSEED